MKRIKEHVLFTGMLKLPRGATIVHVSTHEGLAVLYEMSDPTEPLEDAHFLIIHGDQPFPDGLTYVGTAIANYVTFHVLRING